MKRSDYFNRQIQLWGEERQKALEDKKILIVGAGGLGSSLSYALGTSGIGKIDIVDFDRVSLSNIHRQIAFNLEDRNKYKAQVVAKRVKDKSPFVDIAPYIMSFKDFTLLDREYDLILDATDNIEVRREIESFSKLKNIPWIYGSVEEFNGQVCFFEKSSFSNIFDIKKKQLGGVHAPIVMHIASLQANLAIRYLVGLKVARDKLYYIYFDMNGELILQKFNMPI
jgi:adenylyltransferase/sulfurtransferase